MFSEAMYNMKKFEYFETKVMHKYLIQFENLYKFYQFFLFDFLGQIDLILPDENVSQGAKCPNTDNLHTTEV